MCAVAETSKALKLFKNAYMITPKEVFSKVPA